MSRNTIQLREFIGVKTAPTEELPYEISLSECLTAKEHALQSGDLVSAGYAAKGAAECQRRLGRLIEAGSECRLAVTLFNRAGHATGLGWALFTSGNLLRQQSRFAEAYVALQQALALAETLRAPDLASYALAGVAETTRIIGRYHLAYSQHVAAYQLFRAYEDVRGEIWALEGIGQILRNCGKPASALRQFAKARTLAIRAKDARGLAYALKCHGECMAELGHLESAVDEVAEAIGLFDRLGFQVGLGYSLKALGDIHHRSKDVDGALEAYNAAGAVFERLGDSRGAAFTLKGIAAAEALRGNGRLAAALYQWTHSYFVSAGVRFGAVKSRIGLQSLQAVGLITKAEGAWYLLGCQSRWPSNSDLSLSSAGITTTPAFLTKTCLDKGPTSISGAVSERTVRLTEKLTA